MRMTMFSIRMTRFSMRMTTFIMRMIRFSITRPESASESLDLASE